MILPIDVNLMTQSVIQQSHQQASFGDGSLYGNVVVLGPQPVQLLINRIEERVYSAENQGKKIGDRTRVYLIFGQSGEHNINHESNLNFILNEKNIEEYTKFEKNCLSLLQHSQPRAMSF